MKKSGRVKLVDFVAQKLTIGVISSYTDRGIGTAIVSEAANLCVAPFLIANVSEKNRASERCLEKNGFKKYETSDKRHLAAFGEDHNFNLWVLFVGHKV